MAIFTSSTALKRGGGGNNPGSNLTGGRLFSKFTLEVIIEKESLDFKLSPCSECRV
jgi:hypothetical protein